MSRLVCAVLLSIALPTTGFAESTQSLIARLESLRLQLMSLQQANVVSNSIPICDVPTQSMHRGMSGGAIANLQQFLAGDRSIYPEAVFSGYYGALTEKAVQRWQIAHGVVLSGTPATTGFGVVGPRTLSAMRASWCILSKIAPSPFTPPPGATIPRTGTSTAQNTPTARIMFTLPATSTSVYKGNTLVAAWKSDSVPLGASVSLSLQTKSGVTISMIKSNLDAAGSFSWTIPAPPSPVTSTCTSDPFNCLAEIAQTSVNCGTLCSIDSGLYKFVAQLVSGSRELARAESRIFSIGGATLSATDVLNTGTVWDFSINYGTSSYSNIYSNSQATNTSSGALPCIYSSVPYADGITVEVNCADVTAPGSTCGAYAGLKARCQNGTWINIATGQPVNLPNIATSGGSIQRCSPETGQNCGN